MLKSPYTPNNQIKHALRQLWLRSRERAEALKNAHYTCEICGKKQSQKKGFEQKVEVHHKKGIGNWEKIIEIIRTELLPEPDKLQVLCPECHAEQP